MVIEIKVPDSMNLNWRTIVELTAFMQAMANRICVGQVRYGLPVKRQRYMSRAIKELQAYKESGNAEQLFNLANYAFLESYKPENKKIHWDASVDSVTRGEFGI